MSRVEEQPIPLDPEQRTALAEELCGVIEDAETEHREAIADVGTWWQWYDGVPDVPIRTDPWPGASNLVVPLIKTMSDSTTARTLLTIFGTRRVWMGTTEDESFFKPRLNNILRFLNHGAMEQLFDPLHDGIGEDYTMGEGYWQQRWVVRERYVVPPNSTRPVRVMMGSGPWVDHIPRERILFPFGQEPRLADFVILQRPMSWNELARMVQLDGWDGQAVEDSEGMHGIDGPGGDVWRQKRALAGQTEYPASSRLESHDIRVCYIDWPFFRSLSRRLSEVPQLGDSDTTAIWVRGIVTLHRKSRRILKAIYDPNSMLEGWPIYRARYRNGRSRGLAKTLEHLQRGLTTMVNQAIDTVTRANSMLVVTSDQEFARRRDLRPGQVPFISNVNDLKEFGQKPVFPDIAVSQLLQAYAERAAGQSDPALGRETRMGGHPSPATNFLGLLEQSQVIGTLPVKNIRKAVSQMGEDRALFYHRWEANRGGWIQRIFGDADGGQVSDWLESDHLVSGKVAFDVHALSEIHNPDGEMRKAILIDQVTSNFYVRVLKLLELTTSPDPRVTPPMREAAAKAVEAGAETLTRVLEAAEVDEIEKFVFRMRESNENATAQLGELAGILREAAQGQDPGAQGPLRGNGVGAFPGGTAPVPAGGAGAGGAGSL